MYTKLKQLYNKKRLDVFCMAVTYITDVGYRNVSKITDEEISSLKENGLMTQEFVQELVKYARDICKAIDNPSELYQFCSAEDIFDTWWYAEIPNHTELIKALNNAICSMRCGDYDGGNNQENLCDYLDIDEDVLDAIERA